MKRDTAQGQDVACGVAVGFERSGGGGLGRGSFDEMCAKSAISAKRPSMGDGCKVTIFKLELSFGRR
jgi:hypothetical protein